MRILLTTTSFQDTPGEHHDLLARSGHELVRARGPLTEPQMIERIERDGPFDATINGDDAFTPRVIDALRPNLRCIGKYGIGLDSIDVGYASRCGLPVLFTPGVNHTTVAEHAVGLMIAAAKHFVPHLREVKAGRWKRITGTELADKTLGVLGMGRIGKELIKRAGAFGMKPLAYDPYWDEDFAAARGVDRAGSPHDVLRRADVASLHLPLTDETRGLIDRETIASMPGGAILINTARGALVVEPDVAEACRSGKLGAYATDVLNVEPVEPPHPFQDLDNVIVTPHVASRTRESVERQAVRAATNVLSFLEGGNDYIQANEG